MEKGGYVFPSPPVKTALCRNYHDAFSLSLRAMEGSQPQQVPRVRDGDDEEEVEVGVPPFALSRFFVLASRQSCDDDMLFILDSPSLVSLSLSRSLCFAWSSWVLSLLLRLAVAYCGDETCREDARN
eukprot:c15921_g1_i1 orf=89-469(-)